MHDKKISVEEVERYQPKFDEGLSLEQVSSRMEQGLSNKTDVIVGKSTWEILRTSVLTFFNILLFIIAGVMIYANVNSPELPWYHGLFFVIILLSNIIIGLYQDLKAKHLMKKMKLITSPEVIAIRENKEFKLRPDEVVLDDILFLSASDQIVADATVLDGEAYVNESLLTGESVNVLKKVGDSIFSGTYVVSGKCYAKVEKVGKDNYIETIAIKAKSVKRNPSHIVKSLKKLFRVLGTIVIVSFAIIMSTYAIHGSLSSKEEFVHIVSPLAGQLIAMIPAGLNLLSSMALAAGVISLYRKNANVQDMYSIEMLARSDVLCVDKTGTITDGSMSVQEVVPLNEFDKNINEEDINLIVSNVMLATGDDNMTAKALNEYFKNFLELEISTALPFNSDNKYSGATFSTGVTYILGAAEFLDLEHKEEVIRKSEQYTSKGYRVLLLTKGSVAIKDNKYNGKLKPLAFIVLQDHIKEDAKETFKWFADNDVMIKVISGDNAITVSEIAKQAGIANANKYISLEGMSLEEVHNIASEYTVFGRVTPEQKEEIVKSLKESGKTVAMTGDGVNDILALKVADCSIAMNSGSQATKNVAHVILMNNDFSTMPKVVGEGRRVINNLQRTGSLFLTKTFFAVFMSFLFWIVSISTDNMYSYPFSTNNMIVYEVFGIGMTAFFISLEPDSEPIKRGFLRNIISKAVPGSALIIVGTLLCYLAYILQSNGLLYTGVADFGYMTSSSHSLRTGATALAVLTFTGLSFVVLYLVCKPFTKYRAIVMSTAVIITIGFITFSGAVVGRNNLMQIDFSKISSENILLLFSIIIVLAAIYLFVNYVVRVIKSKPDKKEDKKDIK